MDEFPQAELVDYHETQRGQVVSPSSSKALVLYKLKAPRLENLQERLEDVVRDLVLVRTSALEIIVLHNLPYISTLRGVNLVAICRERQKS